jgi:type II secretory pathway pseudopilin PulG
LESRKTKLLIALIIAAGLAALIGYSWENRQHEAAAASVDDLAVCRQKITELAQWGIGSGSNAPLTADDSELNRRLHAAAADAGMTDALASIDPGQPHPLMDTEYDETLIFLRANGVTIRQLVEFLHKLSLQDASLRTKSIELGIPTGQPAGSPGDTWTADVTLSVLTYAPLVRPK